MNFYTVKFSSEVNQAELCDKIRSSAGECIQISDGLVMKSEKIQEEVEKDLYSIAENITVIPLDPLKAGDDPSVSKDTKVFIGIN